ncbi:DUF3810 domain-containing protein [Tenacibaculum pacificus]|uniref:DUF3810 domain-containing protein n=1 Tax=Tenacibaculum pacificus TaxID=3018314 RepID=UPI0022F3D663|nr:DUF3810 domain-containing protein [Tenacibaculum pacificus]WBX74811.1 DUF3810 domain-containing protein [Tenacibaculum pacificus]
MPFSFSDVLGFVLLFLLIKGCYSLIKNKFKNSISKILQFTSVLSLIYFCFYAFWGLNYFREPLAKNLNLQQATYTTEQLVETTEKIVFELNKIHLQITNNDTIKIQVPYTQKEIYGLATNGYLNLSNKYPQLTYKNPSIKNSLVSLFQSYNGTSGYISPITGEAQINDMIPKTGYPATTCREMAHQIGWAAENDANFVGFLASVANNDLYFQYSGYRMAYIYCINQVYKRDKKIAKSIKNSVNKGIYKDFSNSRLHWKQFKNPIEPYFKKGYNSYLKANNQSKGIKSYSYVVDLLIAYFDQNK